MLSEVLTNNNPAIPAKPPESNMSSLGFNPIAAALSFIQGLQKSHTWQYDPKSDARDDDGKYTGDGASAIQYGVSIGQGRGSCKVELTGDQLPSVATALRAFDPDADLSGLTPAECVERTITREKDGTTVFKLSLAKNSRAVRIPKGEWDNFLGYVDACAGSVPAAVEHYRSIVAQHEAEANAGK